MSVVRTLEGSPSLARYPLGPSLASPLPGGEGAEARRAWQSAYVRRIVVGDVLCALVAASVGYLVRFGAGTEPLGQGSVWAMMALPLIWAAAMLQSRSYEPRFLWVGAEEFRRVSSAAVVLLATVGTVSWAFKLEVARGFMVIAAPLATVLTLLHRYMQRTLLYRQRLRGRFQQTTLLVGYPVAVTALRQQLDREAYHGYRVVGYCLPGANSSDVPEFDGLPVLGDLDEVVDVVVRHEVDTVAVLPCPDLDGPALRRLGWELETTRAELLLAPAVTEVAGPRVRIRPVCGLPLLHVERPELRGLRRFTKEAFDRVTGTLAVLLLLPFLLGIALAVKVESRGPVLFRQIRVGRNGRPFQMYKFRSMVTDAERLLPTLEAESDGNGVLFKKKLDPRVTRVGRVLRRSSIDELPQLFNVLRGDMSLVGPRPPLPSEVERYGGVDMHRRFLVKPGLTGLWQVSGRSNLSWEDSVRIDVRYVENWTLTFDLVILWKTIGAVLRGSGAY
jgi:exopolysaccharide biosynthesis polyprenyl glycosylphosphotransferase